MQQMMNRTKMKRYGLMLALLTSVAACENPLKDLDIQISTDIIQHSAVLNIVDSDGENIEGSTVTLVSGETADIYNMAGYKDFKPLDGNLVNFGVDPKRIVSADNPVNFKVRITAEGFKTREVAMSITDTDM